MANYILDAHGVVENLRSLLRDQYDPRSIFKELVQNADDARSSVLHFACHPGWADHDNPLLRVPALLVLNDGPFLPQHAVAFTKIGIGSKSGDDLTIGKFGRGLKSIFHLCEAFFYFGSEDQAGLATPAYREHTNPGLLNPWEGTDYHLKWGCDADILSLLQQTVHAWPHHTPSWFCLWLPLKCPSLLDGVAPLVQPDFCSLQEILTADFARRAAELLPLLRNLHTITYWQDVSVPCLSISLNDGAARRRYPPGTSDRETNPTPLMGILQGTICCREADTISTDFRYYGQERLSEDVCFEQMRAHENWPTVSSLDPETGANRQIKDTTQPHAAVVFQQIPSDGATPRGEEPSLQISRAVFLPLTDSEETIPFPDGNPFYRLHLHGCYFVDAGRRDVVLRADERATSAIDRHKLLAQEWNGALEARVLLPLVLPALHAFARDVFLSFDQLHQLTAALCRSKLLTGNASALCTHHLWLARLSPDGVVWALLPTQEPYYLLPAPLQDVTLPFAVMPELTQLCQKVALGIKGLPRLTGSSPGSWQTLLPSLIDSVPVETVFSQGEQLEYLTAFLVETEAERAPEGDAAGRYVANPMHVCLIKKIRTAFQKVGVSQMRQHLESMRRLCGLLPPASVVLLPDTFPTVMLDTLVTLPVAPLLLPADLWPIPEAAGCLAPVEAAQVLAWLETAAISPKLRSDAALIILANTGGELAERADVCGDYCVFHLRSRTTNQDISASWRQIIVWQQENRFVARDLKSVKVLAAALETMELYHPAEINNKALPETLLPNVPMPELYCDPSFCIRLLNQCPALTVPEQRTGLLRELLARLANGATEQERRALRYLLHGDPTAFHKDGLKLYWSGSHTEIWTEVVRRALHAKGQAWRLIATPLGELLSETHRAVLGLITVDGHSAEALLREAGPACLQGWESDTATREAILLNIQDTALWRELPLHRTLAGELIPLQDVSCYLRGRLSPPPALIASVQIIDCPEESPLRQRYKQAGMKEWDAWGVLRTALRLPDPAGCCMEILEALETLQDKLSTSEDLLRALKKTVWLPGGAHPVAPQDVLRLNDLNALLTCLLARPELKGQFFALDTVDATVRQHAGFAVVARHLFPSVADTFAMLAEAVTLLPEYTVGEPVWEIVDVESLHALLDAFTRVDLDEFPGLALLREVSRQAEWRPHLPSLYHALRKPLTLAQQRRFFTALKQGYSEQQGPRIYNAYFRALARRAEFTRDDLAGLPLRDGRANWKTADRLCEDWDGIDPSDRLRDELLQILREEERQQPQAVAFGEEKREATRPSVARAQGADVLESYFGAWIAAGAREEVVGLFLALLSDQADIVALAQKYLGERQPIPHLLQHLDWTLLDMGSATTSEQNRNLWKARAQRELTCYGKYFSRSRETQPEAFALRAFRFRAEDPQGEGTVEVANLLGGRFQARRSSASDSLFLGELEFVQGQPGIVQACLRHLPVERLDRNTLHRLLYEASYRVLREVYVQNPPGLLALFEKMAQSEQLHIEATQRGILRNAFFYFRQLDTHHQQAIRALSKQWRDLDYAEENERAAAGGKTVEVDRKRDSMLKELAAMLENETAVQEEVRQAVQGKVEQQQYTPQSILFELFQNADDAVREKVVHFYGDWQSVPHRRLVRRAVLAWSAETIQWMHWGRAINQCRGSHLTEEKGRELGFHDDLWKMLVLAASDKHSPSITGKFGLGFKSVFLLTNTPRLVSGDLRCEIVAGMYPRKLVGETSERLARALDTAKEVEAREAGTLIDLPLRREGSGDEALVPFLELAHLLPIFARGLERIDLRPLNGPAEAVAWQPHVLGTGVTMGGLQPTTYARLQGHVAVRALVLRPDRSTDGLLLVVGPGGIVSLPPSVPAYWVTTPARGSETGAGMAINARFEVDPGRVQLANKPENVDIAQRLGARLNPAFAALAAATGDWNDFRTKLGFSNDTTPPQFWQSLLQQAVAPFRDDTPDQQHYEILRHMLWTPNGGMAELLTKFPVLPTGLFGRYEELTSLPEVRWLAEGLLDETAVFCQVAQWDSFRDRYTPGQIVSTVRIGQPLQRLNVLTTGQPLSLCMVLEEELPPDRRITRTMGEHLGRLLTPDFLDSKEQTSEAAADSKEKAALRERLRPLLFPSHQGTYAPARDLLITEDPTALDEEEKLRAAFCPDASQLSEEFTGAALAFFKACRGPMHAPAERLVEWGYAIGQGDSERQQAFLDYLLQGGLCGSMQIDSTRRDRCWLGTLPTSPLRSRYSESEWTTLLGRAGFSHRDADRPKTVPQRQPNLELHKIAAWWQEHRDEQILHYDRKLYPDGGAFLRNLSRQYQRTPEERVAWMTLLLRSSLETMGRAKVEQHREFLNLHATRWVRNLVSAASPGEALYADLRAFMDSASFDITYLHWVRHYAPVAVFATWLDDIVDIVLQLEKIADPHIQQGLEGFLRARHNVYFQGSGLDAPPLTHLLGLGIHFLIRELTRAGVLTNPVLRAYGFVPTAKIRRLMEVCGLPLEAASDDRWRYSERIYAHLQDVLQDQAADFCREGDIPLQIVASDPALWGQFLPTDAFIEEDTQEWNAWEGA